MGQDHWDKVLDEQKRQQEAAAAKRRLEAQANRQRADVTKIARFNPRASTIKQENNINGNPFTTISSPEDKPDDFFESYKTGLDIADAGLKGVENSSFSKYYVGYVMTPVERRAYWLAKSVGMNNSTPVGAVRIFDAPPSSNALNVGKMAKGAGEVVGGASKIFDIKDGINTAIEETAEKGYPAEQTTAKLVEIQASGKGGDVGLKAGMAVCPKIPNKGGLAGVLQNVACISIFAYAGSEAGGEWAKRQTQAITDATTTKVNDPKNMKTWTPEYVKSQPQNIQDHYNKTVKAVEYWQRGMEW